MTTLIETASEDGERAMNREVRAAEKDREKTAEAAKPADGGVLAVSLSSEKVTVTASVEELKQKAFEKLSKEASDWMEDVIADAVAYAKEKSPREKEFLNRVLHKTSDSAQPLKQSEIASMFATSVWPSLKSRGWKAEVISEGDSAGKTRYSFEGKDVRMLTLQRPAGATVVLSIRLTIYCCHVSVFFNEFGFESCPASLPRIAKCY